jgi:hypothetical protein
VITITGISDHLRLEWPITITGMRRQAVRSVGYPRIAPAKFWTLSIAQSGTGSVARRYR